MVQKGRALGICAPPKPSFRAFLLFDDDLRDRRVRRLFVAHRLEDSAPRDARSIWIFSRERHRIFRIGRSEEHTSELQSLMRISYAVFCLKKKQKKTRHPHNNTIDQKH